MANAVPSFMFAALWPNGRSHILQCNSCPEGRQTGQSGMILDIAKDQRNFMVHCDGNGKKTGKTTVGVDVLG